ncbi:transglycosylase family protein [Allokutzneria multivorans]|uniref:Transglycosylase family protein n=1 Tax=Allokutzneria multivorans TaxID=1142134 RepID=A0ABP7R751_9PSEU
MTSYRGKHRKQSTTGRNVARLAVAGAVAAAPFVVTAGTASAAPNWEALAKCESGGNASINSGNGYYGAYQFDSGTWRANGGGQYAPNAHQATLAQQTEIAQRLYDKRGATPWPGCSKKTGWANGGGGGGAVKSKPVSKVTKKAAPKPAATPAPAAAPVQTKNGADYTVAAGDTLSKIASAQNVEGGWQAVFERNKDVIKDANLIFVGQQLDLK